MLIRPRRQLFYLFLLHLKENIQQLLIGGLLSQNTIVDSLYT